MAWTYHGMELAQVVLNRRAGQDDPPRRAQRLEHGRGLVRRGLEPVTCLESQTICNAARLLYIPSSHMMRPMGGLQRLHEQVYDTNRSYLHAVLQVRSV